MRAARRARGESKAGESSSSKQARLEELACELHHLESLENDYEPIADDMGCDIVGKCVETEDTRFWQSNEFDRREEMATFKDALPIAEAEKWGFRVIGAMCAINEAKEKARLVVQDLDQLPEHWAPIPSTTTLRTSSQPARYCRRYRHPWEARGLGRREVPAT